MSQELGFWEYRCRNRYSQNPWTSDRLAGASLSPTTPRFRACRDLKNGVSKSCLDPRYLHLTVFADMREYPPGKVRFGQARQWRQR